jgi:hypothetical protein
MGMIFASILLYWCLGFGTSPYRDVITIILGVGNLLYFMLMVAIDLIEKLVREKAGKETLELLPDSGTRAYKE